MTDDKKIDDLLEAHFSAARKSAKQPDAGLVSRVLEAAEHEQAARQARLDAREAPTATRSRLSSVFKVLGGWPAAARDPARHDR